MSHSDTIVGLGTRGDFVAVAPNADPVRLNLSADEAQLFASVGRAAQIGEVLQRSGMAEPRAIAVLLSLRAKGAIVPAKVTRPAGPTRPVDAAEQEEVELSPERKKEILELERKLDGGNHFEVLGVPLGTSAEDARKAYYEASKKFHPDRFYGKNLGSFRGRVERIFRRLTEASNVLCNANQREAYEEAHPELFPRTKAVQASDAATARGEPRPRTPEEEARDAERRARFARHPYLAKASRTNELIARARVHAEKGEHGKAYTDLHLAAQVDPKNLELARQLEETKRKMEAQRAQAELARAEGLERAQDLQGAVSAYRAAASADPKNGRAAYKAALLMFRLGMDAKESKPLAQRACEVEPQSADYKVVFAQILLQADMKSLAKRQLEDALKLSPSHEEAKKLLKKLRWPF